MKVDLGEFRIVTDENQFIIQERKIYGEGKEVKEENRGKEYFTPVAYHGDLERSLKFIAKKIVLRNDDVVTIVAKLRELENSIKELTNKLEIKY